MVQIIKPDFQFNDERGSLIQLVHKGYEQVNVLKTNKGVYRGGHYHKESRELFYVVSGRVEVTLVKSDDECKMVFKEGDCFQIEPYVVHSMYFPSDCVMVAMYDKCVEKENGTKDIFSV